MNTDELTQIATAHQSAIGRTESRLDRIEAILERVAYQQEASQQAIAQNQQAIAQLSAEQQLSRQDINNLTASILSLGNLVADYIQNRENLDRERRDS